MAKSTIKVGLKIKETTSEISNLILDEMVKIFHEVFNKSILSIQTKVRTLFRNAITSNEVWDSLTNGKLKAEFGLPDDVTGRLNEILDIWLNEIMVDSKKVQKTSNSVRGGITVNMLENDWINVLYAQSSSIVTQIGQILPWLEWLLVEGDKIIIREFQVVMKPTPQSRSGMAIMIKKSGGRWRVPPEFAGSSNNNFITRILDNLDNDICDIIQQEIENRL